LDVDPFFEDGQMPSRLANNARRRAKAKAEVRSAPRDDRVQLWASSLVALALVWVIMAVATHGL
jgi:hypothetical protein